MTTRVAGATAGVLSVLAFAAPGASAAPVTSTLRVEGAEQTLYEGAVTTDVRASIDGRDGTGPHRCDGTEQGLPAAVPTAGALFATAAESAPFDYRATYDAGFKDFLVASIAGETPDYNADGTFWGFYVNGAFANQGLCGTAINGGEEILLAVATGSEQLLRLTGPAGAKPGDTVELTVTDASSAAPVAGATVDGRRSDAAGKVRVVADERGANDFKATRTGAIRSNRVSVCATDGQDGFCGTTAPGGTSSPGSTAPPELTTPAKDTTGPVGRITGIRERQRFTRATAPRELKLTASDVSGVSQVKLRLTRRHRGKCAYFSGRQEAFRRAKCGRAFFFKAGDQAELTYLLPDALEPGRYVLDVVAIDRAGNRDELARGRSRVVFTVR